MFTLSDQKEQIEQFTEMASKRIQEWIESGDEIKAKLAILIKAPLTPVHPTQTSLAEIATDGTTSRKRPSQEQEEGEKAEKQLAKRRKKDSEDSTKTRGNNAATKEAKTKQHKKAPTTAIKAKETPKQLTNIASKSAEYQASTSAVKEIYDNFLATGFSGVSHESNQAPVTETVHDSEDGEEGEVESDGDTALELTPHGNRRQDKVSGIVHPPTETPEAVTPPIMERPPRIQQRSPSDERSPRIQQTPSDSLHLVPSRKKPVTTQISPRVSQSAKSPKPLAPLRIQQQILQPETPRRAPIIPPTAHSRQEPDSSNQSVSPTGRSLTTLSETAEVVAGAMSSQINGNNNYYPPGGFRDFLARPLSQDPNSERELSELREENSRLHEEISMLRSQLNSCARNQPGKVQIKQSLNQ